VQLPGGKPGGGEVLALPIYPELTEEMPHAVADAVLAFDAGRIQQPDPCLVA
jgi:hypothetical protein